MIVIWLCKFKISITVHVTLQNGFELETECAKKIIEFDALLSSSADGHGSGVTDYMHFTSKASFDKFWDWFSPP